MGYDKDLMDKLSKMSTEELIRYAKNYTGLDGRELIMVLTRRVEESNERPRLSVQEEQELTYGQPTPDFNGGE